MIEKRNGESRRRGPRGPRGRSARPAGPAGPLCACCVVKQNYLMEMIFKLLIIKNLNFRKYYTLNLKHF